jgi:hypothetical protein
MSRHSPPPRHPIDVSEWRLGSAVFSLRIWIYVVCFLVILIYHQVETIMQFSYLWNYFFSLTREKQVHLFQTVTGSDAVDDKACCMLCLHICFFVCLTNVQLKRAVLDIWLYLYVGGYTLCRSSKTVTLFFIVW